MIEIAESAQEPASAAPPHLEAASTSARQKVLNVEEPLALEQLREALPAVSYL